MGIEYDLFRKFTTPTYESSDVSDDDSDVTLEAEILSEEEDNEEEEWLGDELNVTSDDISGYDDFDDLCADIISVIRTYKDILDANNIVLPSPSQIEEPEQNEPIVEPSIELPSGAVNHPPSTSVVTESGFSELCSSLAKAKSVKEWTRVLLGSEIVKKEILKKIDKIIESLCQKCNEPTETDKKSEDADVDCDEGAAINDDGRDNAAEDGAIGGEAAIDGNGEVENSDEDITKLLSYMTFHMLPKNLRYIFIEGIIPHHILHYVERWVLQNVLTGRPRYFKTPPLTNFERIILHCVGIYYSFKTTNGPEDINGKRAVIFTYLHDMFIFPEYMFSQFLRKLREDLDVESEPSMSQSTS